MDLGDVTLSYLPACAMKGQHIFIARNAQKMHRVSDNWLTYLDPTNAIAVRNNPTMERTAPMYVSTSNPNSCGGGGPVLDWISYRNCNYAPINVMPPLPYMAIVGQGGVLTN